MGCTNDQIKTVAVKPGDVAEGDLSHSGVLRFERKSGAMKGQAHLTVEDGALALHYVDGSSVYLRR